MLVKNIHSIASINVNNLVSNHQDSESVNGNVKHSKYIPYVMSDFPDGNGMIFLSADDATYIWGILSQVAGGTTGKLVRVLKIDPNQRNYYDIGTVRLPMGIYDDGTYVWVGGRGDDATQKPHLGRILKSNPTTQSYWQFPSATYVGVSGRIDSIYESSDGLYLYLGCYATSGEFTIIKVLKSNPATYTPYSFRVFAGSLGILRGMVFDESYVYFAGTDINGASTVGYVFKALLSDLTSYSRQALGAGLYALNLISSGSYLYVTQTDSTHTGVAKVQKSDLAVVDTDYFAGFRNGGCIRSDGTYLYMNGYKNDTVGLQTGVQRTAIIKALISDPSQNTPYYVDEVKNRINDFVIDGNTIWGGEYLEDSIETTPVFMRMKIDGSFLYSEPDYTGNLFSSLPMAIYSSREMDIDAVWNTEIGTGFYGMLVVSVAGYESDYSTPFNAAVIVRVDNGVTTIVSQDAENRWTVIKDNASTLNIYFDTDDIVFQNKYGWVQDMKIVAIGSYLAPTE